jgi:hypothetical protein
MRAHPAALMLAIGAMACSQTVIANEHPGELRVSVLLDTSLRVDGKLATLDQLGVALDQLKTEGNGTVAYYREAADREPPPAVMDAAMAALDAIMERGMPIRLSSKPDFSDTLDGEGRSRPYMPNPKGAQ